MSLAAPPIRSPLKKKPANLNRGPDQQNAGLQPGKKRKSPATGTGTHHNTAALVFESTTTATARPPASKRAKKDEAQREAIRQETVEWRRRYKKAFRSFSFYFDHLHSSKNTDLTKACLQLGAVSHSCLLWGAWTKLKRSLCRPRLSRISLATKSPI